MMKEEQKSSISLLMLISFFVLVTVVAVAPTRSEGALWQGHTTDALEGAAHSFVPTLVDSDASLSDIQAYCGTQGIQKVALSEALGQAYKFAPRLHYHPLEEYYLADPKEFLARAHIYDTQSKKDLGPATEALLLNVIADCSSSTSSTYYLSIPAGGNHTAVPYSQNAPIFFNIVENSAARYQFTYIFNFFFFSMFNGPLNMQLHHRSHHVKTPSNSILESEAEKQTEGDDGNYEEFLFNFIPDDIGSHEGDWEHISVEVCGDLGKVVTIWYGMHSYTQRAQCWKPLTFPPTTDVMTEYWLKTGFSESKSPIPFDIEGQCVFVPGTTHPIVHSALNGHGSYPVRSYETLYLQFGMNHYLSDALALSLVDRTLSDPFLYVEPTLSNVYPLYNRSFIEGKAAERLATISTNSSEYEFPTWLIFSGNWGATSTTKLKSLQCIYDNQTLLGACPGDVWSTLVSQILTSPTPALPLSAPDLFDLYSPLFLSFSLTLNGPSGPLFKNYFNSIDSVSPPLTAILFPPIVVNPNSYSSGFATPQRYNAFASSYAPSSTFKTVFIVAIILQGCLSFYRPLISRFSSRIVRRPWVLGSSYQFIFRIIIIFVSIVVGASYTFNALNDLHEMNEIHPYISFPRYVDYMVDRPNSILGVTMAALVLIAFCDLCAHRDVFTAILLGNRGFVASCLVFLSFLILDVVVVLFSLGAATDEVRLLVLGFCDTNVADRDVDLCFNKGQLNDLLPSLTIQAEMLCGYELVHMCNDWALFSPENFFSGGLCIGIAGFLCLIAWQGLQLFVLGFEFLGGENIKAAPQDEYQLSTTTRNDVYKAVEGQEPEEEEEEAEHEEDQEHENDPKNESAV